MEDKKSCIKKGCCSDPLPIDNMYLTYERYGNDRLCRRIKKSSSCKNETLHKGGNTLVQNVSRLGSDLLAPRLAFFIYRHNRQCDQRLGRRDPVLLGTPPEVELLNRLAADSLVRPPFPVAAGRALTPVKEGDPAFEHVGLKYHEQLHKGPLKEEIRKMELRRKAWETVNNKSEALTLIVDYGEVRCRASDAQFGSKRQFTGAVGGCIDSAEW